MIKVNPFRKAIRGVVRARTRSTDCIAEFSNDMARAMGLRGGDISKAQSNGIEWSIGDYVVSARARPFLCADHGRIPFLEARPSHLPRNHGYGLLKHIHPDPRDWHYRPDGPDTEIFPHENIQREILELLKAKLREG